jgi:hypothetical protein
LVDPEQKVENNDAELAAITPIQWVSPKIRWKHGFNNARTENDSADKRSPIKDAMSAPNAVCNQRVVTKKTFPELGSLTT